MKTKFLPVLLILSGLLVTADKTYACNDPPDADLDASPNPVCVGCSVTLDGSGSSDPDGSIAKYEWDFTNDGEYDYYETSSHYPDGKFDGKKTHTYDTIPIPPELYYTVKLRVTDDDDATDTDTCQVTVYELVSVAPSSTTKVMISTKHDDSYPSSDQSEDQKIKITATITPAVSGATVYFRIKDPDPDDGSPYDSGGNDDNRGTPKLGSLSASSDTTDGDGKAETVLTVTGQYAGDNYIVQASCCSDFGEVTESGVLVAWKRIYIEEDKMYKTGSDLASDFTADGDPDFDTITVEDASIFSVGNWIKIFDADNPTGETRAIPEGGISGNNITVQDLAHSYNGGYDYDNGDRGAAVARPNDGFYDADVTGRTGNAFGVAADGSDGGCFVEIKILDDGGGNVPHKHALPSKGHLLMFRDMWFKNKGKSNYIWVCGARSRVGVADGQLGFSIMEGESCSYVFVGTIEAMSSNPAIENANITAHEIGHQWTLTQVDENHPDVWCHEGPDTDDCLMDKAASGTDAYSEFCYNDDPNSPNHIMDVRDAADNL